MAMPKKFMPLIIAVAAALLAVFLINIYIQQQAEEARKRAEMSAENMTTVIIAKSDIPAGTTIKEKLLVEEKINKKYLQPRAATAMDRVLDKIAIAPISKGEQILLSKVTISGLEVSLSAKVPRGKRAITLPVDNISAVGGMVKPGDHVDVVGVVPIPAKSAEGKAITQMATVPLFQNVLVLAVGQELTAGITKKEERIAPTVTLALEPQEANIIAYVQEQGKIRLILRSPEDTAVERPVPADWNTVLRLIMPEAFREQPVVEEVPKPTRPVEIYRGTQKEIKYIEQE